MLGMRVPALLAAALVAGLLSPVGPALADPMPSTATLTKPAEPVHGLTVVAAQGYVDPTTGDTPATMALDVGDQQVDSQPCPAQPDGTCAVNLSWDATGLSGEVTLTVVLTTVAGTAVTSDPVQVNVDNPGPTVVLSKPQGGPATGQVTVQATGSIDATQTDTGESMDFSYNGTRIGGGPCPPPVSATCTESFAWDTTGGNTAAHQLEVTFTTNDGRTATDSVQVREVNPGPTLDIAPPPLGYPTSGVVTVQATGHVDPQQTDAPASMQLTVKSSRDNTLTYTSLTPCSASDGDPYTCSLPLAWDSTGLTGTFVLAVQFRSADGMIASKSVTVAVAAPPPPPVTPPTGTTAPVSPPTAPPVIADVALPQAPTATITSPVANSTVHLLQTVNVTGAVDPSQNDTPSTVTLIVDGVPDGGPVPCPPLPGTRTCSAALTWNTLSLFGRHVISASLTTARGLTAAAAPVSVYVFIGTVTSLSKIATIPYGHRVIVTGKVSMTLVNRTGVGGLNVRLSIIPAVGRKTFAYVTTNAKGYFAYLYKPALNTTIESDVLGPLNYGTSHTFTKLTVRPRSSCVVGSTVSANQLDHGKCRLAGLPRGVKVALQYAAAGHWYTIGSGRAPGAVIPFSFRFAHQGSYLVRLVVASSRAFVASTSPALKVVVR